MGSIARRSAGSGRSDDRETVIRAASSAPRRERAIYELADHRRISAPTPEPTHLNVGLIVGGATAALDEGGIRGSATGKTTSSGHRIARGDIRTLSRERMSG